MWLLGELGILLFCSPTGVLGSFARAFLPGSNGFSESLFTAVGGIIILMALCVMATAAECCRRSAMPPCAKQKQARPQTEEPPYPLITNKHSQTPACA